MDPRLQVRRLKAKVTGSGRWGKLGMELNFFASGSKAFGLKEESATAETYTVLSGLLDTAG